MAQYGVAPGAFIHLADAALITPDNLQKMGDEIRFISRLPVTYHAHGQVIEQVLAANAWEAVGRLAETAPSKNRPGAEYRVVEASVSLEGRDYHAIVVHSSSHDRRQHKRLERDLQRSERHLQGQLKTLCRGTYACERRRRPTRRVRSTHPTIDCESRSKRGPAMRRGGRPKQDGSRTLQRLDYGLRGEVSADEAAIAKAREQAGCFVLLTNVPAEGAEGYSAGQVLASYKEQHGIEKNFGFLKDDAIVNALFLKTPERLEALGLILLISLLIWRLMEAEMRRSLEQNRTALPGWDNKPTRRPTAYLVTIKFKGLLILKQDAHRRLARPLSDAQQAFLHALGLQESIFTNVSDSPGPEAPGGCLC